MIVIHARNVHEALPKAMLVLREHGVSRESRNGPVIKAPWPVATIYHRPWERVVLWPERDANPFFHVYESLWMLAGRNDVEGPARYARQMREYSDDGVTFHGAYGHRWRKHFGKDQLADVIWKLQRNSDDRRAVVQMWDAERDLGRQGRDVPCNVSATFQVNDRGELDLVVFCRSNDVIWGCYGANAVHFSFLLEFVSSSTGYPMGTYTQISVNWHAYDNDLYRRVSVLADRVDDPNPYSRQDELTSEHVGRWDHRHVRYDAMTWLREETIATLLYDADSGYDQPRVESTSRSVKTIDAMLRAHHVYKTTGKDDAIRLLSGCDQRIDWIRAGREWLERRSR